MRIPQGGANRRSGATAVEFAFIAIPLFMFFFGTAEYARFYLDRNILNNAAREGARYGIVNYYSDGSSLYANTQAKVNGYLAGRKSDFQGNTINMTIYLMPAAGGTAVSLSGSGSDTSGVTNIQPGDYFQVQLSGTYVPILPMPIVKGLPTTISMTSTCIMLIEGVT